MRQEIDENKIIQISFDRLFKKVFGDIFGIQRLEGLLCEYFNLPYEKIKGKVYILESDKRESQKINKQQDSDLIIHMEEGDKIKYINIEVNMSEGIVIVRNMTYISYIIGEFLKNKEDYNKLPKFQQINFNNFAINDSKKAIKDIITEIKKKEIF